MVRAYDKLVKRRVFRKGELVLVLRRPIVITHKTRGKFEPKWEGPYAIEQAYDEGAYQLVDPQGARPMPPINGRFLKKILCIKKLSFLWPSFLGLFSSSFAMQEGEFLVAYQSSIALTIA